MRKAFSNKALPAGTVLREWRLEEVLGVGGFGIVYKARGIYFDELVAIKEYFPSSISERDSDDTVVPIDSDAEEVHALGLKKFVEEAKLLWNLSTPSRHPNIVSVRSLFEIHGTAYIVMDFEDGTSLSRMLKQGRRFNERSLWSILWPIAEGLDRAHRVGVLHRDIKPPNILINEDNRPVLIDFGSARFTTAEATSTTVTFHTPPYAAIEQYVKTYEQGPWTDIYALGIVMYECITGEKPPEVLERLHAGLGTPLAAGKWPGYTKRFLAAVDAAMTVKPDERPRSMSDWLAMFGKKTGPEEDAPESDEDATRFFAQQVETDEIVPVPPTPDVDRAILADTGVPDDPKQAKFKRVGEETDASKKAAGKKAAKEPSEDEVDRGRDAAAAAGTEAAAAPAEKKAPAKPAGSTTPKGFAIKQRPMLVGGAAIALLLLAGGGIFLLRGSHAPADAVGATADMNTAAAAANPALTAPAEQAAAPTDSAANEVQNSGAAPPTQAAPPSDDQTKAAEALRKEAAKTAAAEARLAAMQKATAKAAQAQAREATAAEPAKAAGKSATTYAATGAGAGVSAAKLAQFNGIVDQTRAMAAQVMHSSSGQNAQTARNYDGYLKTLKDSMRGIHSDKDADRLIKQANQTRAYVQSLQGRP